MAEPWKTRPLGGAMEASIARHEVMRAIAESDPGVLEAAMDRAIASTQAKHKIGLGRARMVVASVIEGATGSDPRLPPNVTPIRKGRQ